MTNSRKRFASIIAIVLALLTFSSSIASAALIQKAATPGSKWGKSDGGGPFTKPCPSGYVATGVAVANAESFGYTEGFAFTCTQILENGTLGTASTTITQVTNKPSDSSSICPSGYALIGVRVLLRWDPNNNAVFYVNDLGANCAKFTDRTLTQNMTMARNVKLGANNEYLDRESSCGAGFVTGFEGRSGAGLDYAGVLCSTFTDENEGKPSPSYLISKEVPKISQNATSLTCSGGDFSFMRYGAIEEKAVITERVFQLMRDGVTVGTVTIVGKTEGVFIKSGIPGTYACWEQARQENSLAITDSTVRIEVVNALKNAYRSELRKSTMARIESDALARSAYSAAKTAASTKAGNARTLNATSGSDFYASLRAITATYVQEVDKARVQYRAALDKNLEQMASSKAQALNNYYKALEAAGVSILVTKS